MAGLQLADGPSEMVLRGVRDREPLAGGGLLFFESGHVSFKFRFRGLGHLRAGPASATSPGCCGAGCILVCHLDISDAHLLQLA